MDLLKTKIYIDKINREYARMAGDPENIMRIDVDIMLSYVRELYDAILSDTANPAPPARREPVRTAAPEPKETPPPAAPAPPVVAEPAPPPEDRPAPASPPPPVVAESIRSAEPLPSVKPTPPAAPPASFPALPPDAESLFEYKEAKELSERLSNLPIPDLRKAIALNDKLLLTRELFGNDAPAFERAIETINTFDNLDQAKAYLLEHCVIRYRWTEKKRAETARNFIKLVRRRFN
ncbi:MAG: hypothetical protein IPM81_15795 [Saprospirales bacterium]|nr:hypothetical protein [Saprospirales bacterium]